MWKLYLGPKSPVILFYEAFSLPYAVHINWIFSGLEILVAVLLFIPSNGRFGIVGLFVLSFVYFAASLVAQLKGLEIACQCLPFSESTFGWPKTIEASLLLIVCLHLLYLMKAGMSSVFLQKAIQNHYLVICCCVRRQ